MLSPLDKADVTQCNPPLPPYVPCVPFVLTACATTVWKGHQNLFNNVRLWQDVAVVDTVLSVQGTGVLPQKNKPSAQHAFYVTQSECCHTHTYIIWTWCIIIHVSVVYLPLVLGLVLSTWRHAITTAACDVAWPILGGIKMSARVQCYCPQNKNGRQEVAAKPRSRRRTPQTQSRSKTPSTGLRHPSNSGGRSRKTMLEVWVGQRALTAQEDK